MNNKPSEKLNRKSFRLWFGLMIIGPALLLLYFLFQGDGQNENNPAQNDLPSTFIDNSTSLSTEKGDYLPIPNGYAFLQNELSFPNNTVIAEADHIFLVLPMLIPKNEPNPNWDNWYLLDQKGLIYEVLKNISPEENIIPQKVEVSIPSDSALIYLIFKVLKDENSYYLIYEPQKEKGWEIPVKASH